MDIPDFLPILYKLKYHIYKALNLRYYSIVDLVGRAGANGEKMLVDSYYAYGLFPASQGKGRYFVYSTSQAKSTHNGITIISDTVPWDGSQSTLADFHNAVGETAPGTNGCWIARPVILDPFMAGAAGNNGTDDYVAMQNVITLMVSSGIALFIPAAFFFISQKLRITGLWNIWGTGSRSIIRMADTSSPMLEIDINTTTVMRPYMHGIHLQGPRSTNTASCAMRFIGDATAFIQYGTFDDIYCTEFNAFVKDEKTARTTGAGLEGMLNWNMWTNIHIYNTSTYGFWGTNGSGTGNSWSNLKPFLREPGSAVFYFEGTGCVVGDILIDKNHSSGNDSVTGTTFFKVGADTVYRSRITIGVSQFDGNTLLPFDLSSTGSDEYENIKFAGNNIGGLAAMTNLPYMSASIIEGRDVDLRQEGRRIQTSGTGAQTVDCYKVGVNTSGSSLVRVQATGIIGGVSAAASEYLYLITTDGVTLTITNLESTINVSGQLIWTCTSVDANTAKLTLAFTPSSTGTEIYCMAISRGYKHKLIRA